MVRRLVWLALIFLCEVATVEAVSRVSGCEVQDEDVVQYRAAVLEYAPYNHWAEGGLALLRENARIYLEYAAQARAQDADIVVFPEYGLTTTNLSGALPALTQLVPHPAARVVPCHFSSSDDNIQVLRDLSCGAAELSMYLVVNLAEQESCGTGETCYYNTQAVFDSSGAVVARYRKKHLFLEPEFDPGSEEDATALFTTDFNVTFTLQVCFDVMYPSPALANVASGAARDVATSTAWIDELPFLTAPQIFRGWSAGLGVNLLVAGYHNASSGMLGSGIFPGDLTRPSSYTYSHQGGTKLLVASLTTLSSSALLRCSQAFGAGDRNSETLVEKKSPHSTTVSTQHQHDNSVSCRLEDASCVKHHRPDARGYAASPTALPASGIDVILTELSRPVTTASDSPPLSGDHSYNMVFIHDDLERYNHYNLEPTADGEVLSRSLCHNDSLCCHLNYTFTPASSEVYMLLAYSGLVEKGGGVYSMFTQVCAVVLCRGQDVASCTVVEDVQPLLSPFRPYELRGTFSTPYVYPSVFYEDLTLVAEEDWTFGGTVLDNTTYSCRVNLVSPQPSLLALVLFGRWYDNDPMS